MPEAAATHRYKKIVAESGDIDRLPVELFLEAREMPPDEIIPDMDATDDPLHGKQQGRFFHGHHGHYCHLPLYVTCGGHVPCSRLRPPDIDASHGAARRS